MTKIIVNINELTKYSKQLYDDSQEFGIITNNMQEIVESLKRRGWSGYDADTFIKNASTYLSDLRVVKAALYESALIVQRRNKKYSTRIEEYFDKIKFREDKTNE